MTLSPSPHATIYKINPSNWTFRDELGFTCSFTSAGWWGSTNGTLVRESYAEWLSWKRFEDMLLPPA